MPDLDKRLDEIEKKLDAISSIQCSVFGNPISSRSDEINLRELFNILWQGKWWIIGITFLFAVAGVFYALSLPNMYASKGVYAPSQKESPGGIGGQLGGLASLAGVSLGGGDSNDVDQALIVATSWPFLESVITKHNLKPLIAGVKGWSRETGQLIWDEEVYDYVSGEWLREPPKGEEAEPSSYEVYLILRSMMSVELDAPTSMLSLSIEHYSPQVARDWVIMLVTEINEMFRLRDINESKKNIAYLEQKVAETGVAEMQAVFYGMVESQMKTLMLAEVDEQYLFKEVVEPKVAERKSKPKRALLCVLFFVLGGFVSIFVVFAKHFLLPKS